MPSIKRIVTIEGGYVRDTQIFGADPAIAENDTDCEENFFDVKYPNLYVGIYEGADEKEIREKAASDIGVHPDVMTLTDIAPASDGAKEIEFSGVAAAKAFLLSNGVSKEEIEDIMPLQAESGKPASGYVCSVCENENHPVGARYCIVCGTQIPYSQNEVELALEADKFQFERLMYHVGHKVTVVNYAGDHNVSIECMRCNEVLLSVDNPKYQRA